MRLTLVEGPKTEPVSLDEARTFLSVQSYDFDDEITRLIRTARQKLDGPKGSLGRCLMSQRWKLTEDGFARRVEIPIPPLVSIETVSYEDSVGTVLTLSPSLYVVSGVGDSEPAVITFPRGQWPPVWGGTIPVTVNFTAGYGDAPGDVPEAIRHALLMMVAHLFENREAVTNVGGFLRETPLGFSDLIEDYRVWAC